MHVGMTVVTQKETQIRWDCTDFVICVFFHFSHETRDFYKRSKVQEATLDTVNKGVY